MLKASAQQTLRNLELAAMLASKNFDFVVIPAKNAAHRQEMTAMAHEAMLYAMAEAFEQGSVQDAREAEAMKEAAAGESNDVPADDTQEQVEPNFDNLNGDQLYSLLADMRDKLTEAVKSSTRTIKEARGVAKLGFSKGVGMVVFLTSSRSVYDTAEQAEFPGQENCGNPDCNGCNPTAITETGTIH